ncbi:MAG: secondary thiamine-phosphate synthase enzyme YjbQ [Spirochaetota bacterium]
MSVRQTTITIRGKSRGCHLITREIDEAIRELGAPDAGIAHVFLQHTSASLTINENASPDVRADMRAILDHIVPEDEPCYRHTLEGSDDMPAHGKSALLGVDLTIPISGGRLALGTWQGVYLCEHRNRPHSRSIVLTVMG